MRNGQACQWFTEKVHLEVFADLMKKNATRDMSKIIHSNNNCQIIEKNSGLGFILSFITDQYNTI